MREIPAPLPDGRDKTKGISAKLRWRRSSLKAINRNRIHTGSRIADRRMPSIVHISARISPRKAMQK